MKITTIYKRKVEHVALWSSVLGSDLIQYSVFQKDVLKKKDVSAAVATSWFGSFT